MFKLLYAELVSLSTTRKCLYYLTNIAETDVAWREIILVLGTACKQQKGESDHWRVALVSLVRLLLCSSVWCRERRWGSLQQLYTRAQNFVFSWFWPIWQWTWTTDKQCGCSITQADVFLSHLKYIVCSFINL